MAKIQHLLDKIRTAIYGKEVRGSLADGLEAINKETEDATEVAVNVEQRQDAVEQQFDDVLNEWTSDKPISNEETIAARTNRETGENHQTLGQRLDAENKKVTAQLAEKAKKSDLIKKRDKLDLIGEKDITPELQSAINGKAPIANSIPANESVHENSLDKTLKNFYLSLSDDVLEKRESVNLYDKKIAVDNYYINTQSGVPTHATNWAYSGKIPVDPSKTYTLSNGIQSFNSLTYWNEDEVISNDTVSTGKLVATFTTPVNCTHISVNVNLDIHDESDFLLFFDTVQLQKGIQQTDYEEYEIPVFNTKRVKDAIDSFRQSVNIYNPILAVDKKYVHDAEGDVRSSDSFAYTGKVAVDAMSNYTLSIKDKEFGNVTFWDEEIRLSNSYITSGKNVATFTTPQNCTHLTVNIRFGGDHSESEFNRVVLGLQLQKGNKKTRFEPFGSRYLKESALPDLIVNSILKDKVWILDGDSNTEYNSRASKKYMDIIAEKTGVITLNYAKSGSGYLPYQPDENVRQPVYTRIDSWDPDADYITVLAGGNNVQDLFTGVYELGEFGDSDPNESFYGALDYTFKKIIEKYPTKKIAGLSQFKRGNHQNREELIQSMVTALKEVCGYYGVPVLDLYNSGNVHAYNPDFINEAMPDGVHLNDAGHEVISNPIQKFMEAL